MLSSLERNNEERCHWADFAGPLETQVLSRWEAPFVAVQLEILQHELMLACLWGVLGCAAGTTTAQCDSRYVNKTAQVYCTVWQLCINEEGLINGFFSWHR